MGIISVLSSSPWILSCFVLLIIFFLCILFFITLYCYPPFIMLQYSTIVIRATSGIIRVWDAIIFIFFFFNLAVLVLLVGYCSSHYSSRMMTSAAELTMVASSSGFISVMNMNLWYDSDSFSMDSSEVGWHPSSSLIFIFYHFRLGHDGAHLAQILWRWVCISPLCFPFITLLYIYISPHCCFPWHVFFIKMVHYHLVVFHLFLPHLLWHTSYECDIHLL